MALTGEGTGHWYTGDGQPCYKVSDASGNMRPTTLRDARKLNLYPSVTGIMRMAAAPPLEKWKQNKILEAAFVLPKRPADELVEYIKRIRDQAELVAKEAPDTGSAIHAAIEQRLGGLEFDKTFTRHVEGAIEALEKWCGLGDIESEKSFAHYGGFGGKVDIHKDGFVVDFKSKEFTADKLPKVWDDHAMQLAAYRVGLKMPTARCAIIYVSVTTPGLTHTIEIEQKDLWRGWEMFNALLTFWQIKNNYQPKIA